MVTDAQTGKVSVMHFVMGALARLNMTVHIVLSMRLKTSMAIASATRITQGTTVRTISGPAMEIMRMAPETPVIPTTIMTVTLCAREAARAPRRVTATAAWLTPTTRHQGVAATTTGREKTAQFTSTMTTRSTRDPVTQFATGVRGPTLLSAMRVTRTRNLIGQGVVCVIATGPGRTAAPGITMENAQVCVVIVSALSRKTVSRAF